ncbi:TPR-like protein [Ramicandelaber brevisporus]|nr:TPR-like protein [Ramicandelaber brevisporus]
MSSAAQAAINKENLAKGLAFKDEAGEQFKNGEYQKAIELYYKAILYTKGTNSTTTAQAMAAAATSTASAASATKDNSNDDDDEVEHVTSPATKATDNEKKSKADEENKSQAILYSNIAACLLKLERWERAVVAATKAIDLDPDNVKARFRRGQAYAGDGNTVRAEADLRAVLKTNPKDAATVKELHRLKEIEKAQIQKQKKDLAGMFDRASAKKDSDTTTTTAASAASGIEEVKDDE